MQVTQTNLDRASILLFYLVNVKNQCQFTRFIKNRLRKMNVNEISSTIKDGSVEQNMSKSASVAKDKNTEFIDPKPETKINNSLELLNKIFSIFDITYKFQTKSKKIKEID